MEFGLHSLILFVLIAFVLRRTGIHPRIKSEGMLRVKMILKQQLVRFAAQIMSAQCDKDRNQRRAK